MYSKLYLICFSATKGAKWGRKRSDGVEYVIDIAV